MIETPTHVVPTGTIVVPAGRQRREIEETELDRLADSIYKRGLLHPIVLRKSDNSLVVGERRLRAWQKLESLPTLAQEGVDYKAGIPARYTDEMQPDELQAMELEENIQRRDLSWQDASVAFLEYYELKSEKFIEEQREVEGLNGLPANGEGDHPGDPDHIEYTWAMMEGDLNCSSRHCRRMVQVGRRVKEGDKEILSCDSARAAGALLDRRAKRIAENELATFGEVERRPDPPLVTGDELDGLLLDDVDDAVGNLVDGLAITEPDPYEVHVCDFVKWVDEYEGPRFNFVHCDFPYGIGLHKSDLYKTEAKDLQYEDDEDIFWELCNALYNSQDNILSASCHIMFWFPMDKYSGILELFRAQGFRVEPYPLVWMKSDKMGILPDPTRGPRRIYETALIMSLGDRKIVKPTVNAGHYPSGSHDKEHVSQKNQDMLEDFLRMFIDDESVVLDPTCGSGTALAAALKLGASYVVGLDINEECVEIAKANCHNQYLSKIKE